MPGLPGLSGAPRQEGSGRRFTALPSTRAGWVGAGLLVGGWLMGVVPALPWFDPATAPGALTTVLTWVLVAGYASMVLGALVAVTRRGR